MDQSSNLPPQEALWRIENVRAFAYTLKTTCNIDWLEILSIKTSARYNCRIITHVSSVDSAYTVRDITSHLCQLIGGSDNEFKEGQCFGLSAYLMILRGDFQAFVFSLIRTNTFGIQRVVELQKKQDLYRNYHSKDQFIITGQYRINDAFNIPFLSYTLKNQYKQVSSIRDCNEHGAFNFVDSLPNHCFMIIISLWNTTKKGKNEKVSDRSKHAISVFHNNDSISLYDSNTGFYIKHKDGSQVQQLGITLGQITYNCFTNYKFIKYSVFAYKPLNSKDEATSNSIVSTKVMMGEEDVII
ncbi:hypothetical protein [Pelagibaculum spongiae]|uniref:Uncharacterized protein n=1 Tax=Pelagibaculum spongiae TaxID=2080658 RepID=A0A2V1GTR5_9GAMM|nr:hypothetical protein [Pelagibaculum spongiae]PVZ69466.1 hypothetical protein DC094_09010 [Pelagibaculum spongiae]